ncbi:type II toxin-antitoxin system MqsR family toxin [Stappia sp.]|uniref:type II toxin-antitoxin system MqsR family toxin n=1 Tax=Stappia sp. TaxID=1870903 RepID=UPI003A99549B
MVPFLIEKRKPAYDLAAIRTTFNRPDRLVTTTTALKGAAALGMGRQEIVDVIQDLRPADFHKSMTSFHDHTLWQDVYHGRSAAGPVYVKFTAGVVTRFLLLSFKEK